MKSIFLPIITGIGSLILGYFLYPVLFEGAFNCYFYRSTQAQVNSISEGDLSLTSEIPEKSSFGNLTEPIFTPPTRIILSDHGMDIALDALGVNSKGQLEVPTDPMDGGWYYRSAKAGEDGNILINAHYDDVHGRPAAFYNLKNVKVNDTVVVVDSYDRQFPYRVTEIYYISIYDEDRIEKLLESDGASLTLVTCGGFWVPSVGTYNQRLIVKAQLEQKT